MSAGKFLYTKYESTMDTGGIYRIRIQPESALAAVGEELNSPPSGGINRTTTARVRSTNRQFGLGARLLYLKLALAAEPPGEYDLTSSTVIPALTESFYKLAIVTREIAYLNTTWIVTGGRPERLR